MKLSFPVIELIDRLLISEIKHEKTNANANELEYYSSQSRNLNLDLVNDEMKNLKDIHLSIWDLEKELKSNLENQLSLEEIGKRAITIRDLNNKRIALKNIMAEKLDCPVREIKHDHLSQHPKFKSLASYKNPFDAILEFEKELCKYTGAPYAIVTDCCTHAIEIAMRIYQPVTTISFPSRTYLSVLMTMHKLSIDYKLTDEEWFEQGYYRFQSTNIWDYARHLSQGMYKPGSTQCVSFGRSKPLEIGKGGAILTDNQELANMANMMRYDGRDIFNHSPWHLQKNFSLGFHYYLKPEDCVTGLNLLKSNKLVEQSPSMFDYPDCSVINIEG